MEIFDNENIKFKKLFVYPKIRMMKLYMNGLNANLKILFVNQ